MENQEKKKILYAEDEEEILRITCNILRNYNVDGASNLEEALTKIDSNSYDLIISDGLYGGWKPLYQKARDKCKNTPFILYSSNIDALDEAKVIMSTDKNLECIIKPADIDVLRDSVKKMLD
jgi:DNA-binding NtrC family response regulator